MQNDVSVAIQDLPFVEYNKAQLFELSSERTFERTLAIRQAGHFLFADDSWSPLKYEGAAIVTMLDENPINKNLSDRVAKLQSELMNVLEPSSAYYYLPKQSFHQTIANTLSEARFKEHVLDPGLEESYPDFVRQAFEKIPSPNLNKPIRMKMVGLSVFGIAIGMLGVFENEEDYEEVTKFRSAFYSDTQLNQLDVRMTRHFVGHITLAYIERELNPSQKYRLAMAVNSINEGLKKEDNYFTITSTEFRRYYHLAEFIKHDDYPVFHFMKSW
jgi:hypothetical protein